ncbi:MAG: hypothetical protein ACREH3_16555, partial [Geminicoccales bacterium]
SGGVDDTAPAAAAIGSSLRAAIAALGVIAAAASACASNPKTTAGAPPHSFAIYALSRGQGVPDKARAALAEAKAALEKLREQGAEMTLTEERIGLEGETRLCATFDDPDLAGRILQRVRQIILDVDLVNLADEPCGTDRPQ